MDKKPDTDTRLFQFRATKQNEFCGESSRTVSRRVFESGAVPDTH